MQGSRPERVGEQIRQEASQILARDVHDPGIGFVTLTRVKVSPDLQQARIYYTLLGDEKARKETAKALARVGPFLRRQLGHRLQLRQVPNLAFQFDESVAHQDRIEKVLLDLEAERQARGPLPEEASGSDAAPASDIDVDVDTDVDTDEEKQ